ncbi:hypothetical protein [Holdemania massiliensis]|uniref:hypothetical protein n=1 Tax=Holdemania massiliensis TaxID=1468449 RepID=UPI001F05A63D|nr:hypothetical protein [Holdemania massiliensis]MCH1942607.1 hypothetical protein [Holdemania massiliensis]
MFKKIKEKFMSALGITYTQAEIIRRNSRRINHSFFVTLILLGLLIYASNHDIQQEVPQIIHMTDFGFVNETVERKLSVVDSMGNLRYSLNLSGFTSDLKRTAEIYLQVIDFESDPIISYLREIGMTIYPNQFNESKLNEYCQNLNLLNATQWKSDLAYSIKALDYTFPSEHREQNAIYLLSGKRMIILRFNSDINFTEELINKIAILYDINWPK